MLALARTRGVDVDALLAGADIAPAEIDNFDHRIPEAVRARLWIDAAEQSRDALFGLHVADHSTIGVYDVLDYALYFSSTVEEGIQNIVRFHRILADALAVKVEQRGGEVRLRRLERTPPAECEAVFGTLVLRARTLSKVDLDPIEVRFAHRCTTDAARYATWFHCPVRFDAPVTELVVDEADLATPVPSGNPGVQRILARYMVEIMERLPKNASLVELVRATVARRLRSSLPTLTQTARELHTSPRTVQRELHQHGTSFRDVMESVRREMAEHLLAERGASITEIAFLLGFSDVSGFRRMYKRWTGVSPTLGRSWSHHRRSEAVKLRLPRA